MLLIHLLLYSRSNPGFIIIALMVFGLFSLYGYYFNKKARIKRQLKKVPLKRISDIQSGETAQLHGTVEIIGDALKAPLSDRLCGYYHVIVERKVSSGKSSRWETLIEKEKNGFFLIKDGRYYAYVRRGVVLSHVVQDVHFSSGFLNNATEKLEAFLAKHEEKSTTLLGFNKTIRYQEGVLEPGEKVVAAGICHWKQAHELGLPAEYGRILEISTASDVPSVISDDPELMGYGQKIDGVF